MERRHALCNFLVIVAAAGLVLAAGCATTSPSATTLPTPTTAPVPALTTVPGSQATASVTIRTPATLPTTASAATPAPITSDDIAQHFLDIAFGSGNTQLDRLSPSLTIQKPRNTLSLFNGNTDDEALLESFTSEFNDLSATNQFSTNIKSGTAADIVFRFVSDDGMAAIPTESYTKEFKSRGVSESRIGPGIIYINEGLTGDRRSHVILRSLLYEIGFKGETLKYPDSIFYYQDNTNTRLSLIDRKAIQIMYGAGIYPGMTVADVKMIVNVKTSA